MRNGEGSGKYDRVQVKSKPQPDGELSNGNCISKFILFQGNRTVFEALRLSLLAVEDRVCMWWGGGLRGQETDSRHFSSTLRTRGAAAAKARAAKHTNWDPRGSTKLRVELWLIWMCSKPILKNTLRCDIIINYKNTLL